MSTQSASAAAAAPDGSSQLVAAIRSYLQNPAVSWQPTADGRRLIGHMVLSRPNSDVDFGLKIVGGRYSTNGRLCALISRVKAGSLADVIGQLRPGDEVLEWNGNCFQNISHDSVCHVINASRLDAKLELIIARSTTPTTQPYLISSTGQRISHSTSGGWPASLQPYDDESPRTAFLPHSQSLVAPHLSPLGPSINMLSYLHHNNNTPLVSAVPQLQPPAGCASSRAHICGWIEISLCYFPARRELLVNLHRAYELTPRTDGTLRNPYVKLFLLPDRSEISRRQSSVLAETLEPVWEESFAYFKLTEPSLMTRIMEVTLWDWDRYEANSFLGEVLIDMSQTPLDGQPFGYTLVDMDEESPIRLRLRQRRSQSAAFPYSPPPHRTRSQMTYYAGQYGYEDVAEGDKVNEHCPYPAHYSRGGDESQQVYCDRDGRSRFQQHELLQERHRPPLFHDFSVQSGDWNKNTSVEGYLSDTNLAQSRYGMGARGYGVQGAVQQKGRRPRSAAAMRSVADVNHHMASREADEETGTVGTATRNRGRTRREVLQQQEQSGEYGSDGSETLSVNSAQSMQNRAVQRQQRQQQQLVTQRRCGEKASRDEDELGGGYRGREQQCQQLQQFGQMSSEDAEGIADDTMSAGISQHPDSNLQHAFSTTPRGPAIITANMMKDNRKKSHGLMTRLIPGRGVGPSDSAKRMGFARSEEVGLNACLQVPGASGSLDGQEPPGGLVQHPSFTKQASKESTDSSDK